MIRLLLTAVAVAAAMAAPQLPGSFDFGYGNDVAAAATSAKPVMLKPGDRGAAVKELQLSLQALGYLPASAAFADGVYGSATGFAVTAFQKQEGLARDGVAGPATLGRLRGAKTPRPRYHSGGTRVEVSLSKQVVYLIRGSRVERTIAISSGASGYRTPSGRFSVFRKERMSWSKPYSVWLPWASYFTGGIAFHSYDPVPVYPASHGCVRVPPPFAKELYDFAALGTPVTLYY